MPSRSHHSFRLEVIVDRHHASSCADDQLLAHFRANWLFLRAHFRLGMMFVRQREDGNKRTTLLLVIHQVCPAVSPHLHSAHEAVGPIIGASDATRIIK